jgi:hypothetical protein
VFEVGIELLCAWPLVDWSALDGVIVDGYMASLYLKQFLQNFSFAC